MGHAVLYPLLPLTKGGASRKIVTRMFELLSDKQHRDFAVIGYLFAARTFELLKQESNLAWLEERGRHMDDFLSESPAYQWILEKGEAQGIAQGVTQSVAQMRQAIVDVMQEDFPELVQLAKEVVATIDNPAQLVRLTAKLGGAQDAEQAHKILSQLVQ